MSAAAARPVSRAALSIGAPQLLVLRALKLGDLLVAVPALKGIRRAFPGHRLLYAAQGWLAEALDLVGGFELLPAPCRTASWQEDLHERERWLRLLVWHGIEADPADVGIARPPVPSSVPGSAILHVGATYGSRLWPAERFAGVASVPAAAGHRVVFTGGQAEVARAADICRLAGLPADAVLAGRLGLAAFAAAVAEAAVVISADTGAAHLASAYGTPSVILFGPAPPEIWGPPPGPHLVLTRPELRRGDVFAADPDPALLGVRIPDVLAALRELGML